MSLLYKNSRKKHSKDIREDSKHCPLYVKHRLEKVKEQKRAIMSLCDEDCDSSEEIFTARFKSVRQQDTDPKDSSQRVSEEKAKQDDNTLAHENKKRNASILEAKKRKVSKSSDHDTIKNSQNTSKYSSNSKVTESDSNQHRIKSSKHKSSSNTNRKRGNMTKGKGSVNNDSDFEEQKESITTKEKKYETLATISQTFASIHKDDGESSSGKEFQNTKLIHKNRQRGRTLSDSKTDHLESNKSDCSSVMQTSSRTLISKERSLRFKLHIVKILNGFKEVCSEYELQMERVKWKYLKKDLKYEEVATNIVNKTKGMINKLQMEVNAKELELTNFYEKWLENCTAEDIEDDDTSTGENEISEPINFREKSDKSRNESIDEDKISRCDSADIFSESGINVGGNEIRKNKTAVVARGDKAGKEVVNNDNSNEEDLEEMFDSPVLGSNKGKAKSTKMSKKLSTLQNETDNTNDKVSEECEKHEQSVKSVASNDSKTSVDDMFEETTENEESSAARKENEKKKKNVKEKEKGKEQRKEIEKEKDEENENDKEKGNKNDKKKDKANDKEKDNENDKEKENRNDKEKEKKKDNDSDKTVTVKSNLNEETNSSEIEEAKNEDSSDSDSAANEMECSTDPVSRKKILKLETEIIEALEDEKSEMSDDISNELEKLAKKAMLDSDSDISMNEESTTETSSKFSVNRITREEQSSESEKEGATKEKNTKAKKSLATDGSTDNEKEITKGKKRAIRDSNLDDSTGLSSVKEKEHDSDDISDEARARASLLATSNSESLSSDNSSKLQELKSDSSSCSSSGKRKKRTEIEALKDKVLNQNDGQRVTRQMKKHDLKSDEKLRKPCIVNVERLSEEVLQNYEDALEKSREHLNSKTIKNLIDLNKLERNYKKSSDSPRSSLKARIRPVKEKEDTLLDHLNRVENGECTESSKDLDLENNVEAEKLRIQSNADLMSESDKLTKQLLLHSSDSDEPQKLVLESESNEEENDKSRKPKDDTKPSIPKEKKEASVTEDENDGKGSWRRDKLLTMKLSTSSDDSDAEREKCLKKQKKLREEEEDDNTDNADIKITKVKRTKRRTRRKIVDSDSDVEIFQSESDSNSSAKSKIQENADTDSSVGKQKRIRKRKTRKSSGTDSSIEEKKSKSKRRRIKKVASDSDDDSDNFLNSQGTPGSKGRKNIRRVMKDKLVTDDTKQAAKEEEERLKRIAERQKLYNEMYEARLASEEKVDKLVLDFDPETKEELLSVHPDLVKCLKPHQAQGIKFMWDASFESLERIKSSKGTGCIIAHCMGLGKTLQVVSLTHTLLMHEETGIKTVMVVCPLSTVLNWVNEYEKWLQDVKDGSIEVYKLTKLKKNIERKHELECWQRTGGVLIIGYEMYRNLCGASKNMRKNMKEAILQYLIDPGPDMVVCDEGHLLKNEGSALSKTMTRIKTLRRIVLTGTPLQNNLIEYHCMVQFVKPNLLGTRKEFLNRFANPITNGQFDDSTESDVKLMKKRAYVLHKMLKGCVQRFDYSVLTPFLPPKQEYVIFVSLSDVQIKLYRYYLDNFARKQQRASGSLFTDFQALQRIWTHPLLLRLNAERMEKLNENKCSSESEGSLKDFINDSSDSDTTSSNSTTSEDEDVQSNKSNINTRNSTKSNDDDIEIISKPEEKEEKKDAEWWTQFVEPEHFDDMTLSSKLILLFNILQECEKIGDKMLVFSQSLCSLTLIEEFLKQVDDETQNNTASKKINGHSGSWSLGLDYFRLDGSTPPENRNMWCKIFNRPTNTRARLFLISTRAGGLGINLTAANRVIIFDASWNPSHDVQSIFRIYRFGQKKPCYVYRFLAAGTMEEKIYNRQVTKLSLSCRVIDEQQIGRHYSNNNLNELYTFEPSMITEDKPTLNLPKDRLLAETFLKHRKYVENYHEHDSLLENKVEEELNEEERKQAWLEYEEEKKGPPRALLYPTMAPISYNIIQKQYNPSMAFNMSMDYEKIGELIRKDHPHIGSQYQQLLTTKVVQDMYTYWERQTLHSTNQLINQSQLASQLVNPVAVPQTIQNTNTADSSKRTKETLPDDDVVEVTSTIETSKDKNQEE